MLNDKQQLAVDIIEGPVMVVAGPGTGKTHLLAHRVANILQVTDADPSNILCLTFSDAGVAAMRKRLKSIIGIDANKIHIFTFHGFCNKVILENQDFMGIANFEPASDIDRLEIIRLVLAGTSTDNSLNKATGRVFVWEKHLAHLFSWIKRENKDVDDVISKAEQWKSEIETMPDFIYKRSGKWGQAGEKNLRKIQDEQERMDRLIDGCRLFEKYNKILEKRRIYDYDDMIQWVLSAFSRGENLLRRYQEQYLYILVDEFQDTNGAQYSLVKKLASYWDIPNLFIVGDDDQSIFEFQGARLHNISDFVDGYSPEVIILDDNYRSPQNILDVSSRVVSNNSARLANMGYEKNIIGQWGDPLSVQVWQYKTPAEELSAVVDWAEKNRACILYSKHRQVFDLIKVLNNENIPFSAKYTNDVFRTEAWKMLSSFFRYVSLEIEHDGKGDWMLFEWMHFPISGMSRMDAIHIARGVRLENYLRSKDDGPKQTFFEVLSEGDSKFSIFVQGIVSAAVSMTMPEFYDWLIDRSGLLSHYRNNIFELSVLSTVGHFIQAQAQKKPTMDINDLVKLFEAMQENSLPMRVEIFVRRDDAIEVCSAHSAKGLEWDHVIMYDCSKTWEPGRTNNQFKLPPSVTFSGESDRDEAARRAFFVAMTRAKKSLVMTHSLTNWDGKDRDTCQFLDETGIEFEQRSSDVERISVALVGNRVDQKSLLLPVEQLNELIENFVLSPTSLNDYLKCPLSFYYTHLLGVPYFESDTVQFGWVLHEPLAILFRKMRHNDRKFHSKDFLLEWYRDAMTRMRSKFSKDGYARLLPYGEKVLSEYYDHHVNSWPHYTQAEYRVSNVIIGGAPFKGILDRIDFTSDWGGCVTDYKSGKYRKEDFELPTEENPGGGKYWRQLSAYKLLLDRDPREDWTAESGKISFLEPQGGSMLDVDVDVVEGAPIVENLISEAWKSILGHNFDGCGQDDCKFCNL